MDVSNLTNGPVLGQQSIVCLLVILMPTGSAEGTDSGKHHSIGNCGGADRSRLGINQTRIARLMANAETNRPNTSTREISENASIKPGPSAIHETPKDANIPRRADNMPMSPNTVGRRHKIE